MTYFRRRKGFFLAMLFACALLFPAHLFADDDDDDPYADLDIDALFDDPDYWNNDCYDGSYDEGFTKDSEDYSFYTGDWGDAFSEKQHDDDDESSISEEAQALIDNYVDARNELDAAWAKADEIDPETLAELETRLEEAQNALAEFCDEHGFTLEENLETGEISLYDANGDIVVSVGDPVLLASGLFQLDDSDMAIRVGRTQFALTRRYVSDLISADYAYNGAFGAGWTTLLDSRVILGRNVPAENALSSWESLVSAGETSLATIEGYAAEDPNCAGIADDMRALLLSWQTERDAVQSLAALSRARAEKNALVDYSYAGYMAQSIGCDSLIFVDDYGNPIVFTGDGTDFFPRDTTYRTKISLRYRAEADAYTVRYASGEDRVYGGNGLLQTISFAHGGTIRFSYNAQYHVSDIAVNGVRSLHLIWAGNHLASVSDGVQTVSYTYTNNQLASVTDADGDVKSYAYDAYGRMARQIKPDGTYIAFGYTTCSDGKDRTAFTVNENGAKEYFSYDLENRRTTYTDHDGVTSVYEYDEKKRTTKEHYADGKNISYTYGENGKLAARDSMGKRETYRYDSDDHLIGVQYSDGSSLTQRYAGNNLVSYTDRDGVTTTFDYDAQGNNTALYRGGKLVFTYTYGAFGLVTSAQDCRGNRVTYAYDAQGNVVKKAYYAAGGTNPVSTETWEYDAAGRVTRAVDASGISRTYQYAPHRVFIRASNGFENEFSYSKRKDLIVARSKDTVTGEERVWRYEYDNCHNLTRVLLSGTDGMGRKIPETPVQSSAYTGHGRLSQNIIWNGAADAWLTQIDFSAAGDVSRLTYQGADANGNATDAGFSRVYARAWTTDGYAFSETTADGRTITWFFDDQHRLLSGKDGDQLLSSCAYTAGGRLVTAWTRYGGSLAFTYDGATGFFAGSQEIGGTLGETAVETYADGKKSVETNPQGAKTYYYYDHFGALAKLVSDTKTEIWTRDGAGRLTAHRLFSPDGTLVQEESFSYSADGRTVVHTRGEHSTTTYRQNAFGEILSVTDGSGNVYRYAYDIRGRCTERYDGYGNKSVFAYDGKNRLITATDRAGTETRYEYDFDGNCTKITRAGEVMFTAAYDKSGRIIARKEQPMAQAESYEYDGLDRIKKIMRGSDVIMQSVFSDEGKKVSRIDANGGTTAYVTDGFGHVLSEKNRLGAVQQFRYNSDGSLAQTTDFAGSVTDYQYQRAEHTLSVSAGEDRFSLETRDAAGHIIRAQNQDETLLFTYDTAGNLLTQYDENARSTVQYTYDIDGRRIRMQSEKQDVRYQYGKNNELRKITDELNGTTVTFTYDVLDREILRQHGSGERVQTMYDTVGRQVLTVGYSPTNAVVFAEGSVYGANGEKTLTLHTDFSVTRYGYDEKGRLAFVQYPYSDALANRFKTLAAESGLHFTEADADATTSLSVSSAEYTALKALCAQIGSGSFQPKTNGVVLEERFAYDANGNLLVRKTPYGIIVYQYDAEDRLTFWGEGCSAAYDANGNLLQKKTQYTAETYTYNADRRAERVSIQNLISSEREDYVCQYDAFGRRTVVSSLESGITRTVYDGLSFSDLYTVRSDALLREDSSAGTYRYVYIADEEGQGKNRSSAPTRTKNAARASSADLGSVSLYGNGLTPVAYTQFFAGSADRYTLFTDMVGTVKATYQVGGTEQHAAYDVFGAPLTAAGELADSAVPYGFVGKKSIGGSLYDFGYRDYAADTSRFTTTDPARDGSNWYAYCATDPVNYVDLLGLTVIVPDDVNMCDPRWSEEILGDKGAKIDYYRAMNSLDVLDARTHTKLYRQAVQNEGLCRIGSHGCVVSGLSVVVNALTGSNLTPLDVNNNKANFLQGSDDIAFDYVAKNYGLELTTYSKSDGDLVEKIRDLEKSEKDYAALIQVQYRDAEKNNAHWVGLAGIVEKDGKEYYVITKTSANDGLLGGDRKGLGWTKDTETGRTLVPKSLGLRLEIYTNPNATDDARKNQ